MFFLYLESINLDFPLVVHWIYSFYNKSKSSGANCFVQVVVLTFDWLLLEWSEITICLYLLSNEQLDYLLDTSLVYWFYFLLKKHAITFLHCNRFTFHGALIITTSSSESEEGLCTHIAAPCWVCGDTTRASQCILSVSLNKTVHLVSSSGIP